MTRYVVDASVVIKWFLPEVHDLEARRLLHGGVELLVPDLAYCEVGTILWKRVRAGDLTASEAEAVIHTLGRLALIVSPSPPLILQALVIGCETQRTVYDSLYIALALRENALLVTADEKLYNALQTTP